jgi:hypothetical protein
MFCNRSTCLLVLLVLCLSVLIAARANAGQIAEPPEKMEPGQQGEHEGHGEYDAQQHHHLHLALGGEKCEPKFTYEEGPLGPSHWAGLCNSGKMQAPIDIQHAKSCGYTISRSIINLLIWTSSTTATSIGFSSSSRTITGSQWGRSPIF